MEYDGKIDFSLRMVNRHRKQRDITAATMKYFLRSPPLRCFIIIVVVFVVVVVYFWITNNF